MDVETGSTNTSLDDKTEDFCENPTRDTLAEGLMCLLKPTIDQLDERVKFTRISQLELKQQIEGLAEELKTISDEQTWPLALEDYTNKLTNARQKITVVSNILQAAQERLHRVQAQITRETANRRSLLESYPPTTPLEVPVTQSNQSSVQIIMKLDTPEWKLDGVEDQVYEPSEDTFLLLDVLESDLEWLIERKPNIVVEIGCGSGVVVTALSKALAGTCHCIATDINISACYTASKTASLNNAKVDILVTDLMRGLKDGIVDLLIFNPPYVLTEPEEVSGKGIERAWAGGLKGRQVMDKLMIGCKISQINLHRLRELYDGGSCFSKSDPEFTKQRGQAPA